MKSIDSVQNKFYCMNDVNFVYFPEGSESGSYRSDDGETNYYTLYKRLGAFVEELWNNRKVAKLVYDSAAKDTLRRMKSKQYQRISKGDWFQGLILIVFHESFDGVIPEGFIEALDRL